MALYQEYARQQILAVTTASQKAVSADFRRDWILLINDDTTDTIYLGLGSPAVAGLGIRLNANGGSVLFNRESVWHGDIYAIATGNANLLITEKVS